MSKLPTLSPRQIELLIAVATGRKPGAGRGRSDRGLEIRTMFDGTLGSWATLPAGKAWSNLSADEKLAFVAQNGLALTPAREGSTPNSTATGFRTWMNAQLPRFVEEAGLLTDPVTGITGRTAATIAAVTDRVGTVTVGTRAYMVRLY